MESVGADEGLSQGMVYHILQDRAGYLWFGTRDGINRHDGYSFQVYKNDPFDQYSVSDNIIKVLLEDQLGRIWVGTENNGVDVFDPTTGRFFHLSKGENGLSNQNVISLAETLDGAIWVGTEHGLNKVTLPAILPRHSADLSQIAVSEHIFWERASNGSGIDSDHIQSLAVTDGGTLWVGTGQNCYRFDTKTGNLARLQVQEPGVAEKRARANYVTNAPDGSIWVGQLNRVVHIIGDKQLAYPLPAIKNGYHSSVAFDRERNVYVSRRKDIFFFAAEELAQYEKQPGGTAPPIAQSFFRFPQKDVIGASAIYCDRRGLVWIGTNGYGIRKYNPVNRLFKHYLPGVSTRKIRINTNGECWIWTSNGMFSLLKEPTGETGRQLLPGTNFFQHDCIFDHQDNLWLFAQRRTGPEDNSVLIKRNLRTGKSSELVNLIPAGSYSQLIEGRRGDIWVLGAKSQLMRYDVAKETAQKFDLSIYTGFKEYAFVLMEDVAGHIWVGTPHGLLRGTPDQSTEGFGWSLFKNNPSDRNSLNNNAILCVLDDARDNGKSLWVGTRGGGLNLLDKETGACRHYTPAHGLPNDVVYGILADSEGCLWLSTNSGISKFNPKTSYFENYSAADGLQDNEFNTTSYAQAPDGRFYFGGVNGLTVFDPILIKTKGAPPSVQITAIKIHGKLLPFAQRIKVATGRITLPYDQNHITIDFAAMDFTTPHKNQFRYRMLGAHDEWSEATIDHSTTFANLSPGKYVFEVRTGGSHGIWTGDPAKIEIIILAPWWRSAFACFIYGLLAVAIGWSLFRFQRRRIQLREQLAYKHREAERIRALEQLKTNFFNNLTHELRTPITLILEPLRQVLREPDAKNWLEKIKLAEGNSQKLLLIVNQLLDLAKLEGNAMQVEYRLGQVELLLQSSADAFVDRAHNKNITFNSAAKKGPVDAFEFDADKLGKIITNLLSNAMKFTPKGGRVDMSWATTPENWFVLEVFNSGPGIPTDDLPKIFDRFYSKADGAELQQSSTGIGLALCRELAELMGGRLEAESQQGMGSTFRLWLPMLNIRGIRLGEELGLVTREAVGEALVGPVEPVLNFFEGNSESQQRPLLLLAEDNQELRRFISSTLAEKYEVLEATDGQAAAQMALKHIPDIIVSDLMMPQLDGLGLLALMKNNFRTSHIPFLMLTAKTELENRVAGIQQGADAYLGKPFQTEELLAWLHNLLESRRQLQESYHSKGAGQGTMAIRSELPTAGPSGPENPIGLLDRKFLAQFLEIVEAEIDNDRISPAEIARQLAMSRSQLHRKLTALTGLSVSEYLRHYRLDRAMELLRNGAGNVSEVAWKVGFVNAKHFSTAFKEKFGKSPSEV